jgi:hypothetical protein
MKIRIRDNGDSRILISLSYLLYFLIGATTGWHITNDHYKKQIKDIQVQMDKVKTDSDKEVQYWQGVLKSLVEGNQLEGVSFEDKPEEAR